MPLSAKYLTTLSFEHDTVYASKIYFFLFLNKYNISSVLKEIKCVYNFKKKNWPDFGWEEEGKKISRFWKIKFDIEKFSVITELT